jgi:hypothetical protein
MTRIPEFHAILIKMAEIHKKKNEDYASTDNPFSNFERSAELISWFEDSTDKAFVGLIGVKLARLAELLQSGKTPVNESIDDSFLDLATYCALWGSYRKRKK